MSLHRVCIIDDDPSVREAVTAILTSAGYEVLEAADGEKGLKIVETVRPDLVITDLVMPNREGIETIRESKKRFPEMPILAISASGRVGYADFLAHARKLGADACLAKPFGPDELLAQVTALSTRV